MSLPAVDFDAIAKIANEAIQTYGTPAEFFEQGNPVGRQIKCVVYRDATAFPLLQDADAVPAFALLDVEDFKAPNRTPQQFDQIHVTAEGLLQQWTLNAEPHPVYAAHRMPIFICELTRG